VLVLAHEGKWLQGTITSGGQPVEGAKILMDLKAEDPEMEGVFFRGPSPPNWSSSGRSGLTGALLSPGAYEIRNCAPGTYEVEIRAPGMAKLLTVLEVPGGSDVLRKDFELHPGGVVRGWLVRQGRPSPGWVHVFRRTGPEVVQWKESVRARADGLFSFADALDDGSYLLSGFAKGHPAGRLAYDKHFKARALPGEIEVRVEGGAGPQEVVLESAPGDCAVTGRVLAHLHYTDGVRAVKAVRIEGSMYRIEHLRPGRLVDLVFQCEPGGEALLLEPLPGFAIDREENTIDLGPVRERAGENRLATQLTPPAALRAPLAPPSSPPRRPAASRAASRSVRTPGDPCPGGPWAR
jgi:hypothetical protein